MPDPIHPTPLGAADRGRPNRALLVLLLGGVLILGCRPETAGTDVDAQVTIEFDPSPPAVGTAGLKITLTDPAGQPVQLGTLEVEGNMNHAGMRPVFTRLQEAEPGRYAGTLEFTMGGDWFLLLSGQLAGGGRFNQKVDVPGVKPK